MQASETDTPLRQRNTAAQKLRVDEQLHEMKSALPKRNRRKVIPVASVSPSDAETNRRVAAFPKDHTPAACDVSDGCDVGPAPVITDPISGTIMMFETLFTFFF